MSESRMLARLKRETESLQHAADGHRISVMTAAPTPAAYVALLSRIYGFEAPVEAALAMTVGLEDWIDLRGRLKIRLLRADLGALGVLELAQLPRCPSVFPFRHPAVALGWLYAIERDMLLHGLVERHLRSRLPAQLAVAGSYLGAQGSSAGARWRELGEALDRIARTPAIADRVAGAARAALRCQHAWYQHAITPRQRVA